MKFKPGNKVRVKGDERIAEVLEAEEKFEVDKKGQRYFCRYKIQFRGSALTEWKDEKLLTYPEEPKLENEEKVDKLLIDIALDNKALGEKRFDIVRGLANHEINTDARRKGRKTGKRSERKGNMPSS